MLHWGPNKSWDLDFRLLLCTSFLFSPFSLPLLSLYFFFTLFVFCRILSSLRMDCKSVVFSLESLKNIYLFPKGINHHRRKQFIAPNSHSEKVALTANIIKWCFDWRMTLYINILTPLTLSKGMAPVKVNYCWRQTNWKRHLLFSFLSFKVFTMASKEMRINHLFWPKNSRTYFEDLSRHHKRKQKSGTPKC